eukprot:6211822-Pleurochrysis_carterae.AAC.4
MKHHLPCLPTLEAVKILEFMASAAIAKMYDPRISVADKLASQDGVNSYAIDSAAHKATMGAHNANDAVEVSHSVQHTHALRLHAQVCMLRTHSKKNRKLVNCSSQANSGRLDNALHRFQGVLTESAPGVAQQMRMHYFDEKDKNTHRHRASTWHGGAGEKAEVLTAMAMRTSVHAEVRADLAKQ